LKKSFWHYLDNWEEYILGAFMAFMLFTLFIQVFCRYVLSFSFSWAEQAARLGFVWLTMIGISLAAKKGMHLKIDVVTQFFPCTTKVVNIFANTVTILFGFGMGYLILKTVIMQFQLKQCFSSIPWLPVWTMYLAGVLGLFGLSIRTIQNIITSSKHKNQPETGTEIRAEEHINAVGGTAEEGEANK